MKGSKWNTKVYTIKLIQEKQKIKSIKLINLTEILNKEKFLTTQTFFHEQLVQTITIFETSTRSL
jgi:hypothetical protein